MEPKKIKCVGGKAFPKDYNWKCAKGHINRSFEAFCYACQVDREQEEFYGT